MGRRQMNLRGVWPQAARFPLPAVSDTAPRREAPHRVSQSAKARPRPYRPRPPHLPPPKPSHAEGDRRSLRQRAHRRSARLRRFAASFTRHSRWIVMCASRRRHGWGLGRHPAHRRSSPLGILLAW